MSRNGAAPVHGISIVCVFNDIDVRQHCLDRSISDYQGSGSVDYVPVDNTAQAFTSAGAALNHGARRAQHDVVVFVHQDVYLHSIDRLIEIAQLMTDDGPWGLLGASGVTASGGVVGRLRDKVQLLGSDAPAPVAVDSLDEVLFMIRRSQVLAEPLSEDAELAWHAYGIEYGLRMKALGRDVGAVNLAVTHNSLTINLARLDVAHARVAALHPSAVPVRTTCGVVGGDSTSRLKSLPVLGSVAAKHGWRYQWFQESRLARRASRRAKLPAVIGDIRRSVDGLEVGVDRTLHVVNVDDVGGFAGYGAEPLCLLRREQPVKARAVSTPDDLVAALGSIPAGESTLVTDLDVEHVEPVGELVRRRAEEAVLGVHDGMLWLLTGSAATHLPETFGNRRATSLGTPVLH
ncbi:glycosyltransferase [Nocardioides speluncae]|uniref:glycosyltransferase n=1 Tax=Nocardioides speluncae TaxID=2670337 RepID=UPI00137B683A|nr:glycosyltransferase [Nocardioides speluncae]